MNTVRASTVGLVLAGAAGIASLAPSMVRRDNQSQLAATALSCTAGFAIGAALDALVTVGARTGPQQLVRRVAMAGAAGLVAAVLSRTGKEHSQAEGIAQTVAYAGLAGVAATALMAASGRIGPSIGGANRAAALIAGGALAGGGALAVHAWSDRYPRNEERGTVTRNGMVAALSSPIGIGVAALAGASLFAGGSKVLSMSRGMQALIGGGVAVAGAGAALLRIRMAERTQRDRQVDGMSVTEAYFLEGATTGLSQRPIRHFGAMTDGVTLEARAAAVVDELERQGAFSREAILVVSPTGTGIVDPGVAGAFEHMTDGSSAIATMQFSDLPSVMSLGRTEIAADSHVALVRAVQRRADELVSRGAIARKPKVFAFGQSLGAWAQHRALEKLGEHGGRSGLDGVLWVGLPGEKTDVDSTALVPDGDPSANLQRLPTDSIAGTDGSRIYSWANVDDPVSAARFSSFLAPPERYLNNRSLSDDTSTIERQGSLPWFPVVSGIHMGLDLVNATRVAYDSDHRMMPHDYTPHAAALVNEAFGFGMSTAAVERVQSALDADARDSREKTEEIAGRTSQHVG